MAWLRIDGLLEVADQRYQIKIEDVDYFLRLKYLPRTRSFYLSLDDQFEVPIQDGVRMVTAYPLFFTNQDPRKEFSGAFFALRFVEGDGASTFDLESISDGTWKLYYAPLDELTSGPAEVESLTVEGK